MKRYLLFAWDHYEAFGGWNDFFGDFDSVNEAKEFADSNERIQNYCDSAEIIDTRYVYPSGAISPECVEKFEQGDPWEAVTP